MAGWSKKRVTEFKAAFSDFLRNCKIDSKETGGDSPLILYGAQKRFLNEVFDGLQKDIHYFVCLKARQLGISTVVRALLVFWAYVHPGLRIALVYDTDSNKEDARQEIKRFVEVLPGSHRLDTAEHNRYHTVFPNGSRIAYFVAGIKKSKGSGGLGRSRGINCAGCTEISSWGDIEGLRAFERSLAETFHDRLYIWESTARGFNIFHEMWEDAKADDLTKKAIFIGWWAKEIYRISEKTHPEMFKRYGTEPPDEHEQARIDLVAERYGHVVDQEQLAWYRHEFDPNREGDDREHAGQDIIQQELPWTEEEAFLLSGSEFFPGDRLTETMRQASKKTVRGYNYYMTDEFTGTVVEPAKVAKKAWLKVWQEPEFGATYVLGADPAYGSSDDSYNHCAQVLRCYADGVEQVAEFCSSEPDTRQFAWALVHLAGAYENCRFLLELNGPGHAVWNEIRNLRTLIEMGYLRTVAEEHGLTNIFRKVRDYMWAKEDSIQRNPSAFHWETNTKRKIQVMERLRALFNVNALTINSIECIKEMQKVVRDGDSIAGEGTAKYDRVMAMALAVRAWEDGERPLLIRQNRTRVNEAKRQDLSPVDMQRMFSESIVADFFQKQRYQGMIQRARERRHRRSAGRWGW